MLGVLIPAGVKAALVPVGTVPAPVSCGFLRDGAACPHLCCPATQPGNAKFRRLAKPYYRSIACVLVVYDITRCVREGRATGKCDSGVGAARPTHTLMQHQF